MTWKILTAVLVVAVLFLVYSLVSQPDLGAINRKNIEERLIASGNAAAIDKWNNVGAGHF